MRHKIALSYTCYMSVTSYVAVIKSSFVCNSPCRCHSGRKNARVIDVAILRNNSLISRAVPDLL